MAEQVYFTGEPRDAARFRTRMNVLRKKLPSVAVGGRIGRVAMYAAYGWPAEPVELCFDEAAITEDRSVDIDLLMAWYKQHKAASGLLYGPPDFDPDGSFIFDGQGGLSVAGRSIPVEQRVFTVVNRTVDLAGSLLQIPTFTVGTQLHIQRLTGQLMETGAPEQDDYDAKYTQAHRTFEEFARHIRLNYQGEFLPEASYAPFAAG